MNVEILCDCVGAGLCIMCITYVQYICAGHILVLFYIF